MWRVSVPKDVSTDLGSLGRKKRRYADPGARTSQMPEMCQDAHWTLHLCVLHRKIRKPASRSVHDDLCGLMFVPVCVGLILFTHDMSTYMGIHDFRERGISSGCRFSIANLGEYKLMTFWERLKTMIIKPPSSPAGRFTQILSVGIGGSALGPLKFSRNTIPTLFLLGLDEAYLDITRSAKKGLSQQVECFGVAPNRLLAKKAIKDHVEGAPEESDFDLRTDVITAESTPGSNDVLVKNLYLSIDPYQLNRMKKYTSSHETSNYAAPLVPDKTIDGYGVGRVVASAKAGFEKGDLVAEGLQDKIQLVPIDLWKRPAWYKEKVYPKNKVIVAEHD
ncbi:hypothetical protein Syun_013846 [Stephania yunnanensis]|uniref:Oxidoreductase N-terminal domain-containing protein n=1 Tax=Stephania yunnanensis TaxID=152371 RepID=A0AAP0PBB3_9MAGN